MPNAVSRIRRFYRHGSKDHVSLFPSPKAKTLLTDEGKTSFDVAQASVPASFLRAEGENISLLREIVSTIHHLATKRN